MIETGGYQGLVGERETIYTHHPLFASYMDIHLCIQQMRVRACVRAHTHTTHTKKIASLTFYLESWGLSF